MVFKRRNKLSWGRWLIEGIYPRSGWRRAASYVGHRLRRLPDTPEKIARGIGMGVFVSFTPFFGLHFVLAGTLALLFRGNVVAAILGTFFGNPLTFPFIGAFALASGQWMLGVGASPSGNETVLHLFSFAAADFWYNFKAVFTARVADWSDLRLFVTDVFLPYLAGGLLPGAISAFICYSLSRPVIAAYQKRRKGKLLARGKERRAKKAERVDL